MSINPVNPNEDCNSIHENTESHSGSKTNSFSSWLVSKLPDLSFPKNWRGWERVKVEPITNINSNSNSRINSRSISQPSLRRVSIQGFTIDRNKQRLRVPEDVEDNLLNWKKNAPQLSLQQSRILYDDEDVRGAITKFIEEYKGNWHEMVNHCTDKKTLQIINDLRASELEYLLSKLKEDFKKENVSFDCQDFGSKHLTSDRDLTFKVMNDPSKEALIAEKFNCFFEERWNLPSATVFDVNAYTSVELSSAQDPLYKSKMRDLQKMASLLAYRRLSPKSYAEYKKNIIENLPKELKESMQKLFELVEDENAKLEGLFDERALKSLGLGKLNLDKINKKDKEEVFRCLGNPDLEIKVKNSLNKELLLSVGEKEEERQKILIMLKKMDSWCKSSFPDKNEKIFQDFINMTTPLMPRLESMKNDKVKIKQVFKERFELEGKRSICKQNLEILDIQIEKSRSFSEDIDQKMNDYKVLVKEMSDIELQEKKLLEEWGEYWVLTNALQLRTDALLVEIQKGKLLSRCFAAEAHVSEGAFGLVVRKIQSGEEIALGLDDCMQAMRELMSFYLSHLEGDGDVVKKLINVSKYADRFLWAVEYLLNHKVELLEISPPKLELGLKELNFFKKIFPLRGNESLSSEKVNEIFEDAIIELYPNWRSCSPEERKIVIESINSNMIKLLVDLEVWFEKYSNESI